MMYDFLHNPIQVYMVSISSVATLALIAAFCAKVKISHMGLREYLWNMLPDKCQIENCQRYGTRGNEQWVCGVRMCDYCHSEWMEKVKDV